jgi:hypothetical protein
MIYTGREQMGGGGRALASHRGGGRFDLEPRAQMDLTVQPRVQVWVAHTRAAISSTDVHCFPIGSCVCLCVYVFVFVCVPGSEAWPKSERTGDAPLRAPWLGLLSCSCWRVVALAGAAELLLLESCGAGWGC